jgi:predicted ATPase
MPRLFNKGQAITTKDRLLRCRRVAISDSTGSPRSGEGEDSFHTALAIAREQGTRGYELRAATSLARLWREQGRRGDAHDLLAPVYGWFKEGFDTADLKEVKALLDALS